MVIKVSATAAGLAATILAVGVAVIGCGSDKSSSPSSSGSTSSSTPSGSPSSAPPTSSSSAAQPSDYSNLLIKPTDIVVAGDTFTLAQSLPVSNPAGATGLFLNQSGSRKIDDTLYVYPDAGAAGQARDMTVKTMTDPDLGIKGTPAPVDVGSGGTMAVGTSSDGSKAKASLMFTEGKVFVDLEFESPPNDPVPPDFVLDIARKQDAAVKSGMPA